jgi:hypothetical protein
MDQAKLAALGAEFLERTARPAQDRQAAVHRQAAQQLGLRRVHPPDPAQRKIVDARRHPLDCCFSNFRQHFARGQAFTYGLEDIGRYYADYVRAMDHYDRVLPGRVHRVIHERLLDDPEREVRAMLDYLGLAVRGACLAFHRSTRPVRTASSEQVRRRSTATASASGAVRDLARPLREALGDLPETYAAPPGRDENAIVGK